MDAYIAPTWSWASLNGHSSCWESTTSGNDMVYHASAETEMVLVGDEYGPIKSAKLLLKCSPSSIVLSPKKNRTDVSDTSGGLQLSGTYQRISHVGCISMIWLQKRVHNARRWYFLIYLSCPTKE
jgi:hypothetical protein